MSRLRTKDFKFKVVEYARKHNKNKAAVKFGTNWGSVDNWCKAADAQRYAPAADTPRVGVVVRRVADLRYEVDILKKKHSYELLIFWLIVLNVALQIATAVVK